jgi:ribosomal protein S18 acetylase RimI-like enzyme
MKNLTIRKASAKDIEAMVEIRKEAFTAEEVKGFATPKPSFFYSTSGLRKNWKEDNRLKDDWEIYVAEDEQIIVGYIVFKTENGAGYIDNINVPRQQQRKGVGRELVACVEGIAKSRGIQLMRTDTTENAQGKPWKSYSFWTKMGYKDTGERLPTKWDFKEISFAKNLE